MKSNRLKRAISIVTIITFIFSNSAYGVPSSRSLFKNKRVDHKKLSTQREKALQRKKSIFQTGDEQAEKHKRKAQRALSTHLKDLTQIHIPSEIGRVIEVYDASDEPRATSDPSTDSGLSRAESRGDESRLIVHIQDLHTNPEAELNLANIFEILLKDYNLGLVCSEGADGEVDTSSVSSFPDYEVREKTARIFINSGELTGEEYLSITKYPDLPIWGIEDRDIYFKNIIEFNRIMKFSPSSQVFISQTKKALEALKPKIYSKELRLLDQKETDYKDEKIETDEYLKYLTSYLERFNIPTKNYKNITLLNEAIAQEQNIDQLKIMQESQNLLINLRADIAKKNLRTEMDSLMVKAQLFKEQKISPFSFYSYLKDLALRHIPDKISKYPNLFDFIDYLTKINSLDSTKLFIEMEALTYDVKQRLAKTDEQKTLTKALRNINFLEGFFNLKVSNEELDYYLENRDSHKVSFFKDFLTPTLKRYNISSFIDYNPDLIDAHLQELEDFYETVKARDVAMVRNALSEVEKRDARVAALVSGGFHTKGITRMLRERGYSYIVVSPYSSTDIDEENYHFLLSGQRKPIEELIKQLDLPEILTRLSTSLRVGLAFDEDLRQGLVDKVVPAVAGILGVDAGELTPESILDRIALLLTLGRGAEKWERPITGVEIKSPEEGVIIMRVFPQEGNTGYVRITRDEVRLVSSRDFRGRTVVRLRHKAEEATPTQTFIPTLEGEAIPQDITLSHPVRIAMNGVSPVGIAIMHLLIGNPNFNLVAIAHEDIDGLIYRLTSGADFDFIPIDADVEKGEDGESIIINGKRVAIVRPAKDREGIENLPWKEHEIDIVLETTGGFTDDEALFAHIEAGARKVIKAEPAENPGDIAVRTIGLATEAGKDIAPPVEARDILPLASNQDLELPTYSEDRPALTLEVGSDRIIAKANEDDILPRLASNATIEGLRETLGLAHRLVWFSDDEVRPGEEEPTKDLLGGKGFGARLMTLLGFRVPPVYTISTEVCNAYLAGRVTDEVLRKLNEISIKRLEQKTGKEFDNPENPLTVSVRSGAKYSMPGMMDTILNVGLNDEVVEAWAARGDARLAWDSYHMLLQMFGSTVYGVDGGLFQTAIDLKKTERGAEKEKDLLAEDWKDIVSRFKEIIKRESNKELPQDPREQLHLATQAVFKSWLNPEAAFTRGKEGIPHDLGTAVNVQMMVYGNKDDGSGTGVAFSRDPSTGENKPFGEFLGGRQGEAVVAALESTEDLNALKRRYPDAYRKLLEGILKLEQHPYFRDMVDVEYTVESGVLWFLQVRPGRRSARASLIIAMDMYREGLITAKEALMRVKTEELERLLHDEFDPEALKEARDKGNFLTEAEGASPGDASGRIALTKEKFWEIKAKGKKVILLARKTTPADAEEIEASAGVGTIVSGRSSHAALVTRGWGIPCVIDIKDMEINLEKREVTIGGKILKEGDFLSLGGSSGEIFAGEIATMPSRIIQYAMDFDQAKAREESRLYAAFQDLMALADEHADLESWANADTGEEARIARNLGAKGIGLARTEHMFLAKEFINIARRMLLGVLVRDNIVRDEAIGESLPMQKRIFEELFEAMDGSPVIIRLLDPPLHEFLGDLNEETIEELAREIGRKEDNLRHILKDIHQENPMFGYRGARLLLHFPDIVKVQVRAILEAAINKQGQGVKVMPEIMVPVVSEPEEFVRIRAIIRGVAEEVFKERKTRVNYKIGTMLETPRGALLADEIIKADSKFSSLGTNDLSQGTLGESREDVRFIPQYIQEGIYRVDPFATVDDPSVGALILLSSLLDGKGIEKGICGEHGGDPETIELLHAARLSYASASSHRVPITRLAAAQAAIIEERGETRQSIKKAIATARRLKDEVIPAIREGRRLVEARPVSTRISVTSHEDVLALLERGESSVDLNLTNIILQNPGLLHSLRRAVLLGMAVDDVATFNRELAEFREKLKRIVNEIVGKETLDKISISLLDISLSSLVNVKEEELDGLSESLGISKEELTRRIKGYKEENPAFGERGARLLISRGEDLFGAQLSAIFEAAKGFSGSPTLQINIPYVSETGELDKASKLVNRVAKEHESQYELGIIIETPKAAMIASDLVDTGLADALVIDLHDFTQNTWAMGERDAQDFLEAYLTDGIIDANPFDSLDQRGVFVFITDAIREVRETSKNPDIPIEVAGPQLKDEKSRHTLESMGIDGVIVDLARPSETASLASNATLEVAEGVLAAEERQRLEGIVRVNTVITEDKEAAEWRAARRIADVIKEKNGKGERAVIGFATGGTYEGIYAKLIKITSEEDISWENVVTFNLDEYVWQVSGRYGYPIHVRHPAGYVGEYYNRESYEAFMERNLFNWLVANAGLQEDNIHLMDGRADDPEAEAERYEALIMQETNGKGVDLQVLGIGEEGHIAFIEPRPDMPLDDFLALKTRVEELAPSTRKENSRFFDISFIDEAPTHAITQGISTILKANQLLLVGTGPKKRDAIQRTVAGEVTPAVPASVLQLHESATVIVDQDAAQGLIGLTKSTEEARLASRLQAAIDGDKGSYQEIKSRPVDELIAYFEEGISAAIENLPEDLFGFGFGYDIRGNAQEIEGGIVNMTPENLYLIGKLLGSLQAEVGDTVLVTGDLRHHTPILRYSLALGYASVGVDVDFSEEILTTGAHNVFSAENPARYKHQVQISGSHGVPEKNGAKIKVELGKGLLEPFYAERLAGLYTDRSQIRTGEYEQGKINEVDGIQDAVVEMYDETLPAFEKDEIVVIDPRAGAAGPFVEKFFKKRGFTIVDMDEVVREGMDIVDHIGWLWAQGNRRIAVILNMHPDASMSRGIWDPSKPEALIASQELVTRLNEARSQDMPRVIGTVFDADADRMTAIKENGEAVPSFEMTLPFYQRFLLHPQNRDAIIKIVEAGGDPIWVACDVRSNNKLSELLDSINGMYQEERGARDKIFITGWMINTGYPPQLDFVRWRINEMDRFVERTPALSGDAEFMKNYEHLKRTYFTAEASGHNFFQAAPGNPYRPCDDALAVFSVLLNIRETISDIEAPALGMEQRPDYELTELFNGFPVVFSSGEVRVPIPNEIKIPTARKIGAWLKETYGAELRPNSDEGSMQVGSLLLQPKEDGFITVAGFKAQFEDGRSALVRWSNTGEQLTLIFTGYDWSSCITIMQEVTDRLREEGVDTTNLLTEIERLKGLQSHAAVKALLARLDAEDVRGQMDRLYGRSFEEAASLGAEKMANIGFETKRDGEKVNRLGWTLENVKWLLANPDKIQQVLDDGAAIRDTYKYVIFCGMGGSGLSVQTVKTTFGEPQDPLSIYSLRTTDPAVIKDILDEIARDAGSLKAALSQTLVIPISKSGTTMETISHKEYFEELFGKFDIDSTGNIWVITDKGSPMDTGKYTRPIQLNKKGDIGGRFTAPTTHIFLLPLALVAPERTKRILNIARAMNEIEDINEDTFIVLGAYLYHMAADLGKDKVSFIVPEKLRDLAIWSEQLFEESLGKDGKGVTIFYGEDISRTSLKDTEDNDRVFLRINIGTERPNEKLWSYLKDRGYPVLEINVDDIDSIGGIMLGLQRTVATIGYLWGICFVDQPAVEGYKSATSKVMEGLQPGAKVEIPEEWESISFRSIRLYYDRLIEVGAFTQEKLETEVQRLGSTMTDAPAVYAAIISILTSRPGFEAKELTSYGRMREGMRVILERARKAIFTDGLSMPSKLGEGPDKNHSYQQNIEDGKDMWFSTYLMPLIIEQPDALEYDDNLIRAQTIGTVNSIVTRGRKVALITFDSTTEQAERDVDLFFKKVKNYLRLTDRAVAKDIVELAEKSRRQQVDSRNQIIVVPALAIIQGEARKESFRDWVAKQPKDVAVVILANRDEAPRVEEYQDIAYIKVIQDEFNRKQAIQLGDLFDIYGNPSGFDSFNLGEVLDAPSNIEKYRLVADIIASGV